MSTEIECGEYLVRVECPHCSRDVEVAAGVQPVLKVKGGEGSLSISVAAKAVPHDCKQMTLDEEIQRLAFDADNAVSFNPETGEINE